MCILFSALINTTWVVGSWLGLRTTNIFLPPLEIFLEELFLLLKLFCLFLQSCHKSNTRLPILGHFGFVALINKLGCFIMCFFSCTKTERTKKLVLSLLLSINNTSFYILHSFVYNCWCLIVFVLSIFLCGKNIEASEMFEGRSLCNLVQEVMACCKLRRIGVPTLGSSSRRFSEL